MSLFEFIIGMISMLMALAVAQLLMGTGRLVQVHQRVRAYLPHTLWIINLFFLAFLHWWSLWDFRDLDWNWAMFFFSLMAPVLLYFCASLLLPEVRDEHLVNLQDHFLSVKPVFLLVLLMCLMFLSLDGPLFGTEPAFNPLRMAQLLVTLAVLISLVARNKITLVLMAMVVLVTLITGSLIRFFPGTMA